MSDYLPTEVLTDILTRLPLKTLVQCTSVCKSWYSLITDPSFITTHINHTIANKNSDLLLLRYVSESPYHKKEHYTIRRDNETFDEYDLELECPGKAICGGYFRIVGSCNGLLCLSDDYSRYTEEIILWNPSIRKSLTLPEPRVVFTSYGPYSFVLGFGFDIRTDDYKVVRIAYLHREDCWILPLEVEVYSLSTGSWRDVSAVAPPYLIFERGCLQAFLNGAVHWIAFDRKRGRSLVLTFNIGDEVFGEMLLPDSVARVFNPDASVVFTGQFLSLFQYDKDDRGIIMNDSNDHCCIWVMKEYGVAESWTKLYTINLKGHLGKTLGFRKNGEVLLAISSGVLVSYAHQLQRIKPLGICGKSHSFHVDAYVESLVLLKTANGALVEQENSGDALTHERRGEDEVEEQL